jgi:hypothetical protein
MERDFADELLVSRWQRFDLQQIATARSAVF